MRDEWTTLKLANAPLEIIDGDRGTNYPNQTEFNASGYCLFLNAGNVTKNGFDFSDCMFITKEKDAALRKGKLERGDVVLTTRGTVGNVAYYDNSVPFDNVRINSGMVVLRAKPSVLLPRFLYFFIRSSAFINQMVSLQTGSAQPQLPVRDINRIEIPLPPLSEQRTIVHILGTLDDKIVLNRRMCATLEEMARAIFRSWFVNFDPVRAKMAAKAEGRDPERAAIVALNSETEMAFDSLLVESLVSKAVLFPDCLIESEIGQIPDGWRVSNLSDLCMVTIGKTPPRNEPQWFSESAEDIPWVSIRDMGNSGVFLQNTNELLTPEAIARFNIRIVPDNTVILSFKLTVGRVAITDGKMTTNEAIAHLHLPATTDTSPEFLYLYLRDFNYSSLASTSSIATAVNSDSVRAIPIIVPQPQLLREFTSLITPLFSAIRNMQRQSRLLDEIRDCLLPRFLSGDIGVSNLLEEA